MLTAGKAGELHLAKRNAIAGALECQAIAVKTIVFSIKSPPPGWQVLAVAYWACPNGQCIRP